MTGGSSTPSPQTGPISILACTNCGKQNRIRPSERGSPHCGNCGKPLAWVVSATDGTFEAEARTSVPVVVDLWAPWCGPCRFYSPIIEGVAQDFAGRVKVIKVNVDENPALAQRFDARSIPTSVVLRDGQVVDRFVGAVPKPQLVGRLTPVLRRAA